MRIFGLGIYMKNLKILFLIHQHLKIAAELLEAKKINLVMDNWFFREAGSKSSPPFSSRYILF